MSSFGWTYKAYKCNTVYGLVRILSCRPRFWLTNLLWKYYVMCFQSEGDDDSKQVKANTEQNEQANDDEAKEVCSCVLFRQIPCTQWWKSVLFLCSVSDMVMYTVMCIFGFSTYLPCLYRKVKLKSQECYFKSSCQNCVNYMGIKFWDACSEMLGLSKPGHLKTLETLFWLWGCLSEKLFQTTKACFTAI